MSVRMFYVDESHDDNKFCLSAVAIRHSEWRQSLDEIFKHRQQLREDYGLFATKEIHARDLVKGRGHLAKHAIGKWHRSQIFFSLLQLAARLPGILLFNVCLDKSSHSDPQLVAWDRLLNRIERTMLEMEKTETPLRLDLCAKVRPLIGAGDFETLEKRLTLYRARAIIVSDEGREREIERAMRKMTVVNFIPSQFGTWKTGEVSANIKVERVIEDPVFRDSARSHFIQLADCIAFALLKREVEPTPNIKKYGIHKMFDEVLKGICYVKASPRDDCGIVRK